MPRSIEEASLEWWENHKSAIWSSFAATAREAFLAGFNYAKTGSGLTSVRTELEREPFQAGITVPEEG